jgi:hypothetical protein
MLTRTGTGRARLQDGTGEWSRTRLLATVALLAALVLVLVAGAGLWIWFRINPSVTTQAIGAAAGAAGDAGHEQPAPGSPSPPQAQQARRDALAAAPMTAAAPSAALPGVLSTRDPGVIMLPASAGPGPAGVPSGFPHTPEGALAQLAAIDVDVLDALSLDHARQVIGSWAEVGAPNAESWSAIKVLASFHSAAGLSGRASSGAAVRATPMMGLVKATDGPDWAVVCVDFEVDATVTKTARIAAADCQRMMWLPGGIASAPGAGQGRWTIAAGPEPAPAPSIWPGTDAAITAGYQNLRES